MVNEKYLLVADNLAQRNKNRLNVERSLKEQETDELVYWLFRQIEGSVQCGSWPPKKSHMIVVSEDGDCRRKNAMLTNGKRELYCSVMDKAEFYTVMEEATSIINEIGENRKNEYELHAKCSISKGENKESSIVILMTAK